MKFNLNHLYKVHAFVAFMLLVLDVIACIQARLMFGPEMAFKYVWLPAIPFIIWNLIIVFLGIYKQWAAFILGLLAVLFSLKTFETFLQLPRWEISFNIYLFASTRFVAELIAIFNLILLLTSSAGIYLMIKKYIDKRER